MSNSVKASPALVKCSIAPLEQAGLSTVHCAPSRGEFAAEFGTESLKSNFDARHGCKAKHVAQMYWRHVSHQVAVSSLIARKQMRHGWSSDDMAEQSESDEGTRQVRELAHNMTSECTYRRALPNPRNRESLALFEHLSILCYVNMHVRTFLATACS